MKNKSTKKSTNQKPLGLIVGIVAVVALGSYLLWQNFSSNRIERREDGPSMVLFWGNTCRFCHDLMQGSIYRQADRTFSIGLREVFLNQNSRLEMDRALMTCGISPEVGGVPMLFVDGEMCLIGTPDIEAYLTFLLEGGLPTTEDFDSVDIVESEELVIEESVAATEAATDNVDNE